MLSPRALFLWSWALTRVSATQLKLARNYVGSDFETDFGAPSPPFARSLPSFNTPADPADLVLLALDQSTSLQMIPRAIPSPDPDRLACASEALRLPARALAEHLSPSLSRRSGFVNYVSRSVASSLGMISSTSTYFRMGVDTATSWASGRGRNSVRIVSRDTFRDGLYVLDVEHMPTGCGTVSRTGTSEAVHVSLFIDLTLLFTRLATVACLVVDRSSWLADWRRDRRDRRQ